MTLENSEKVGLCVLKRIKEKNGIATDWEVVTRLAEKEDIAELQINRVLKHFIKAGRIIKIDDIYKLTEKGQDCLDSLIAKSNEPSG